MIQEMKGNWVKSMPGLFFNDYIVTPTDDCDIDL